MTMRPADALAVEREGELRPLGGAHGAVADTDASTFGASLLIQWPGSAIASSTHDSRTGFGRYASTAL